MTERLTIRDYDVTSSLSGEEVNPEPLNPWTVTKDLNATKPAKSQQRKTRPCMKGDCIVVVPWELGASPQLEYWSDGVLEPSGLFCLHGLLGLSA